MTSRGETSNPVGLPPELAGSVPRDVRLTIGGLVVASLAVTAVVGALVTGIVMTLVYLRASDARRVRERDGVEANAAVVRVLERRGDGPRRVVMYRYNVGGGSSAYHYNGSTATPTLVPSSSFVAASGSATDNVWAAAVPLTSPTRTS
jgi:hypothetical protein